MEDRGLFADPETSFEIGIHNSVLVKIADHAKERGRSVRRDLDFRKPISRPESRTSIR